MCRDLRDGAIVLPHDAPERGNREPAAVKALPLILEALVAERLDVAIVEERMRAWDMELMTRNREEALAADRRMGSGLRMLGI